MAAAVGEGEAGGGSAEEAEEVAAAAQGGEGEEEAEDAEAGEVCHSRGVIEPLRVRMPAPRMLGQREGEGRCGQL